MTRTSTFATVVVWFALLGLPAAWAADPAGPAAAKADASPAQTDDALKTKTRSNQSNDRKAAPPAANDNAKAEAKDKDTVAPEQPAELLKTKTKSNQSND